MAFLEDRIRRAMDHVSNVRNMSVIAHVDHGKTTLTDSLLSRAGVIAANQAGTKCATDTRKDEQQRGITIKSTAISLHYQLSASDLALFPEPVPVTDEFLVHLIDCPGHVDFSSEVTAALRVTDGAMVVVDCVSGVCVQTETVLRQAVQERIRPVLMMNKLDRCILEKQMDMDTLYESLSGVVNRVNNIVSMYSDDSCPMGDLTLDPCKGNVSFGCGLHGWGFSLPRLAAFYSERLGVDRHKLQKKLWGDHFYNPTTRKWSRTREHGYVRAFNKFVLEPLYKVLNATLATADDPDMTLVNELLAKLNVHLVAEERDSTGKALMRSVMRRWLPAGDAMLQMICVHLPSPQVAQRYRTEILYEGPLDDPVAQAMKNCDPEGPLMVYISKMLPTNDKGRFYAFGRVFSGRAQSKQKVRILTPGYNPTAEDRDANVHCGTITSTLVMEGASALSVGDVPCGNIVGLKGVDKFLLKSGTITTYQQAHNMRVLKFSVSPVVRVAVDVTQPTDLLKLLDGLKRLAKSDPMVQVSSDNGQHIVAGAGELHLDVCLKDLEEEHAGVPIKRSEPVVSYMETVIEASSQVCLAKSANKHNRVYMTAQPLAEGLDLSIEQGKITPNQNVKERARKLADDYGMDVGEARKLWCFGPNGNGANLLIDTSKAVQNMNDIKAMVMAGFQWATMEGVLCEENMRGVRVNITDAKVHTDPACRKGGQIIPASRRSVYAAMLTAEPRLLEPVYLVEIQCSNTVMGGVHSTLSPRRGHIFEEMPIVGTPLMNMKAYLPVNEAFGFTDALRGQTGGQAFPQCVFDHWQILPGDPRDPDTKAASVVRDIRQRKGLNPVIPPADYYYDKL